MIASILCPGPSLTRNIGKAEGMIITVNRARDIRRHDWWVCGEADLMGWSCDTRTYYGVCSIRPTKRLSCHKQILWSQLPFDIQPTGFSSVAAIALACLLGASRIKIIGHDATGNTYFDGTLIEGHTSLRWKDETEEFNRVCNAITSAVIKVLR